MPGEKREPQVNVAFRVPQSIHAAWKRMAERHSLSLAEMIRVSMAAQFGLDAAEGRVTQPTGNLEEL